MARFGPENNPNFDGIHYGGILGVQHFTGSMINALTDALLDKLPVSVEKIDLRLPSKLMNLQYAQQNARSQFYNINSKTTSNYPFRNVKNHWNQM